MGPDELAVRRAGRAAVLGASLSTGHLLEDQRRPSLADLQLRINSAALARTAARNVVVMLERRAEAGDLVAEAKVAAARDRALAADDRLLAAMDRRSAALSLDSSLRDVLTGTLQRSSGQQLLSGELERARRDGRPLVVVFVDIDGLKEVNDTQGHLAGDEVIRLVAAELSRQIRSYDVLFRFGGDEFVCGLAGVTVAEAETRMLDVAAALALSAPAPRISVGMAAADPADTYESVLGRADADLYARRAERSGGTWYPPQPR